MGSRFDVYRKRAEQEGEAEKQKRIDALQRRAAALGNFGSGAAVKQEQVAANEVGQTVQKAKEGIDFAQMEDDARRAEIDEGRKFQVSEREAGQKFAGETMEKQFGFARGEREASQGFVRGEREAAQGFARGEREASQNFSAQENALARALQSRGLDLQDKALIMQADQFQKQFDMASDQFNLDAYISMQNLITASGKGDRGAIKLDPELAQMLGLGEDGLFAPPKPAAGGPGTSPQAGMPPIRQGESSKEYRRRIMGEGWVYQNGEWVKA